MKGRAAAAFATVTLTALGSCTLVTDIDVCAREPLAATQVNVRTEGDQVAFTTGAVTIAPDGQPLVVFSSVSSSDAASAELRVARLSPSGEPIPTCDDTAEATLAAPSAGSSSYFGLGTLATPDDPLLPAALLYVEDRPEPASDVAWLMALRQQTGCPYYRDAPIPIQPVRLDEARVIGEAQVVSLGDGRFVVAWVATADDLLSSDVRGAIFTMDEGGIRQQEAFDLAALTYVSDRPAALFEQRDPVLALNVVRMGERLLVTRTIAVGDLRRILLSVHRLDLRNERPDEPLAEYPALASGHRLASAASESLALIVWDGIGASGLSAVYGARISTLGRPIPTDGDAGPAFRISTSSLLDERTPAAAALPTGDFLVGWTTSDGERGLDLRGAVFHEDGSLAFANAACDATDFALAPTPGDQSLVMFAVHGNDLLAVWTSRDDGGADASGVGLRARVTPMPTLLPLRR